MTQEQYVTLETAVLLKEKGFNIPVRYEYHYKISIPQFHRKKHNFNGIEYENCQSEWYSAPTHQMVVRWLREIHNIHINICSIWDTTHWLYQVFVITPETARNPYVDKILYTSYEQAVEAGIKYCLNLITMATIKSYTDIEQSKKLAEILPIKSADAFYDLAEPEKRQRPIVGSLDEYLDMEDWAIPCWSLAALFNVLPPYLFEFERGIDLNVYPSLNGKRWHCSYMSNCTENVKKDKFKLITSGDNLVDACYEMILKLHEQKYCDYE